MRIGFGYDSHRLAVGRRLVLGGKEIPHEKGLLGHSDADVLIHAVCDAILGAVGEGDIGRQFPDTDPAYRDISSLILLERVRALAAAKGYQVCNVDSTIVLEKPKLAPHLPAMAENIAGDPADFLRAGECQGQDERRDGARGRRRGRRRLCRCPGRRRERPIKNLVHPVDAH